MLQKAWPQMPTVGVMGYGVKLGVVVALGFATKMVTKNNQRTSQVVAGALGLVMFDAFKEFVAPRIGLTNLGDSDYVAEGELDEVLSGFVPERTQISGFVDRPVDSPSDFGIEQAEQEMEYAA